MWKLYQNKNQKTVTNLLTVYFPAIFENLSDTVFPHIDSFCPWSFLHWIVSAPLCTVTFGLMYLAETVSGRIDLRPWNKYVCINITLFPRNHLNSSTPPQFLTNLVKDVQKNEQILFRQVDLVPASYLRIFFLTMSNYSTYH